MPLTAEQSDNLARLAIGDEARALLAAVHVWPYAPRSHGGPCAAYRAHSLRRAIDRAIVLAPYGGRPVLHCSLADLGVIL